MKLKAVIFDLDGVIVSTDEYHYQAWKQLADRENIYFDQIINNRLRGVSRMESLDIVLSNSEKQYTDAQKQKMAEQKNSIYRELLNRLTPSDVLPGVDKLLTELKNRNIKIAIGSSSKNTKFILDKVGLSNTFDAIADGNDIKNSKPDPEVFLIAAQKLKEQPENCIVVEDAAAGIQAAKRAGMKAVAVGSACSCGQADYCAENAEKMVLQEMLNLIP